LENDSKTAQTSQKIFDFVTYFSENVHFLQC